MLNCIESECNVVVLPPGPATVRMVSNNGPPLPMPMQVPLGHMVQQIVDENGILTHVILSPQPPGIPGPPLTVGYYVCIHSFQQSHCRRQCRHCRCRHRMCMVVCAHARGSVYSRRSQGKLLVSGKHERRNRKKKLCGNSDWEMDVQELMKCCQVL